MQGHPDLDEVGAIVLESDGTLSILDRAPTARPTLAMRRRPRGLHPPEIRGSDDHGEREFPSGDRPGSRQPGRFLDR